MRIAIAILLLSLISCSDQETSFGSVSEFQTHISDPENGFIVLEETKELIFEARLTPPMKGEKTQECTINLRIKRKDGGVVLKLNASEQEALQREGYLSFDLREDVSLKMGSATIAPSFHHYERNYGLKPSVDMFFTFNNLKVNTDAVFNYRDQLFGQGLVKLNFNKGLFKKCYVEKT
jgi:hypothetical protein